MSKRKRHRAKKKNGNHSNKKTRAEIAKSKSNAAAKQVSTNPEKQTNCNVSHVEGVLDSAAKQERKAKAHSRTHKVELQTPPSEKAKNASKIQARPVAHVTDEAASRTSPVGTKATRSKAPDSPPIQTNAAAKKRDASRSEPQRTPQPVQQRNGTTSCNDAKSGAKPREARQSSKKGNGAAIGRAAKSSAAQRIKTQSEQDYRTVLSRGLAECRMNLISVGIFSFILNLLVLAIPIYLFQVSDRVLTSRSLETLIMLTIVVIGALMIYALLDMVRRFLLMRVAVRLETTLGAPVLSAAAKSAQMGSIREFQTLTDLQQLRQFITGPTILAMFDAPVAPIYFLAVYLIHPQLGLIVTVAALVITAIAFINQRITAVPFARANAFSQRANFQAEALARNAQIVNAMGMIREGVTLWGRETAEALKAQVTAQDRNVRMTSISKFLRLSTQVAMLGWGAYLAVQGYLTGGMMIAASIIGSRALAPVEGLIEGWRGYVQARGGYSRIKALLDGSALNVDRLRLPRPQGRLHVERVLFVPPPTKKVILNGINFNLDPGESLAVVGPSGTGKSTLARMLVGSIAPTSGAVRLDLMDIRNWDPRQFGETVGYLPQDVQLFPATIKANIARLRDDVSDENIFDAAELAGVHEMISQMPHGYETQVGLDGAPLSGGQKQRLGLARAFFGNPRLVVLDEPNSNLDTAGETALSAALVRAKERQITVIAVTQRPALLKSVDKIMLLNEGRVQNLDTRDVILPSLMGPRRQAAGETAH